MACFAMTRYPGRNVSPHAKGEVNARRADLMMQARTASAHMHCMFSFSNRGSACRRGTILGTGVQCPRRGGRRVVVPYASNDGQDEGGNLSKDTPTSISDPAEPAKDGQEVRHLKDLVNLLQTSWEDYQKPRPEGEGDIRDAVLMGLSLSVYVYLAMEIYRAYAAMYKISGMKTISEALSGSSSGFF